MSHGAPLRHFTGLAAMLSAVAAELNCARVRSSVAGSIVGALTASLSNSLALPRLADSVSKLPKNASRSESKEMRAASFSICFW